MMLKMFGKSVAFVALCGALLTAGPIDGRWNIEAQAKKATKGKARMSTLDLKSTGNQIQGNLTAGKHVNAAVDKGVIEGNTFSFVTKITTKKGDRTVYWKGTVDGDELKGTQSAKEGSKHGREFTAKRAG